MNTVTIIILTAAAAVIGYLLYKRFFAPHNGVFTGRLPMSNRTVSPKGVVIYSYRKVPEGAGERIDMGLSLAFADAEAEGYRNFSRHERYTFFLFPRSSKCENPGFLVDASGTIYDQSEWDKDPRPGRALVCAAGMELMHEGRPAAIITDDLDMMATAARYEAEHNILAEVDLPRYNATRYHTAGQGHPIFGSSLTSTPFDCAGGRR